MFQFFGKLLDEIAFLGAVREEDSEWLHDRFPGVRRSYSSIGGVDSAIFACHFAHYLAHATSSRDDLRLVPNQALPGLLRKCRQLIHARRLCRKALPGLRHLMLPVIFGLWTIRDFY